MLAIAYVSHRSTGRIRIRIPDKRKDLNYFSRIQELFEKDPSVHVRVTAITGSVLIEHRTDFEEIMRRAKEAGLFDYSSEPLPSAPRKRLPTVAEIMQKAWVPPVLLGLGTLQVLRGQPLAPTSTLFMDAYRLWIANRST